MFGIMELTNLDVFQVERIWKLFLEPPETEEFSDRFTQAGHDTSDFILGLGALLLIFVFLNIVFVIKIIGKFATKCCKDGKIRRLF